MDDIAQQLIAFIRTHQDWAVVVILITAFGESLAFLSVLFPGTMLLVAAGSLMQAGALPYLPLMAAAVAGALLGDYVSFWIGRHLGGRVARLWPLSRHPQMLPAGIEFFARHGTKGVFIGRFFGPIRAVVPLAAGLMRMPPRLFWLASISSALVWAPTLLLAGDIFGRLSERLLGSSGTVVLVFLGLLLCGLVAGVWAALRSVRPRG